MSDHTPSEATEYETVGPGPERRGSRRGTVIAAVAVPVVAVLGGAAYAAYAFLNGGGPQPADVLPASTVAVVSVDLDPSAGQKIAAITSIRRFPALKKSLGLHPDDDLRKFIFDKVVHEADCAGLDFGKDVKPWLGKRAAFALVDLGETDPTPAIALQVSDAGKAKSGFDALVKCADPQDFSYAVGDDYLIASDSAPHARAILDKGRATPLADDAAYQKWTDEAGDAGVISFYVAGRAADYLTGFLDDLGPELLGFDTTSSDGAPLTEAENALKGFQGLGGTVRFAGGGMELSLAGGGIRQIEGLATVGSQVGDLPADTAVALGFGVGKDFADKVLGQMVNAEDPLSDIEHDTGLDLPEDLQTLLGRAVVLAVGGNVPKSIDDIQEISDVPAGIVIHGDAGRIRAVLEKAEDHLDVRLSDVPLVVKGSDDELVVATSADYASQLLKSGGLGSDDGFRSAVPNADKATGILYLDFDSPWRDSLIQVVTGDEGDDVGAEIDANTDPLRSFAMSSWDDGDVTHALLKLATD
jgi:hypothetical protein